MPFETLEEMAAQTAYQYGYSYGDVTRVLLQVIKYNHSSWKIIIKICDIYYQASNDWSDELRYIVYKLSFLFVLFKLH